MNADGIDPISVGTLALGFRKKPSSVTSSGASGGWWYSVKVLKYLPDVPGVFVQWLDFPFPDSILEAGQIQVIDPTMLTQEKSSDGRGKKRPLDDREEMKPGCKFVKTVEEDDDDGPRLSAA